MKKTTCANSWCDGTPERGVKKEGRFNFWAFGNNNVHKVYGKNNEVEQSSYFNTCPAFKILWTQSDQATMLTKFEATELASYTERTPITIAFPWATCAALTVPDISCEAFPYQRLGILSVRTN